MKKIIIAAIGIVLVFGLVYFKSLNSESTVAKTELFQEVSPDQGTPKLFDQIRDYPGVKEAKITQAEAESECKETLEAIETLPLNTLIYDLTHEKLKLNPSCLFISQKVSPMLIGFPEVCEAKPNGVLTNECIQKLFYFKNYRIHRATKDERLDSLSTEIIISKLIALLIDLDLNSSKVQQELRQVGAKIYERMPESESAAKASMIGYFADDNLNEADKVEYAKILSEVRSKFPQNWEIYEMNLVHQKINSKENFRK